MILQGTTIQLLAFLTSEFPVQFLTKRYGFRHVLPIMMMAWGTVCMYPNMMPAKQVIDRMQHGLKHGSTTAPPSTSPAP
jgi:hypothetical protein